MRQLGVNIDHVATIRQARRTTEPDPVWAAVEAELGGADQITVHLRGDRRHIQDRDLHVLKQTVNVRLNLECSLESEMLAIACQVRPDQVCLVPEKREEVTTEGGLDIVGQQNRVARAVSQLNDHGIEVSLFIDPSHVQIDASKAVGAQAVELHTGTYANAFMTMKSSVGSRAGHSAAAELLVLRNAALHTLDCNLRLNAGHGLTYQNVQPVAAIPGMEELNIGHSIVARAIFCGLRQAVADMKALIRSAAT
ncbi:MAG: pyridoxine 5'-phosphate synthase [Planctomycetaceae bacterium]|nr:pyridoxine 5'-phosphate synthase [Planctomycetaceae bacterium]